MTRMREKIESRAIRIKLPKRTLHGCLRIMALQLLLKLLRFITQQGITGRLLIIRLYVTLIKMLFLPYFSIIEFI